MGRTRFRTDTRLWVAAAGGVFVALGFVDPVAGVAKGDCSLWAVVTEFMTRDYHGGTLDIVIPILFRSALLTVPAALGWVVQALVVVVWSAARAAELGGWAVPGTAPPL
ncbi:MAG TPA: hypothetical protein VH092_35480 [Urbifossiella sp.]|jgi:hypothetical protein|nr:hypothetical protein [Urbifossiella sp.]